MTIRAGIRIGSLLLVVAGSVMAAAPQVIKTGVNTVSVYATVTDAKGKIVTDLKASDFQVEDNGRRQSITVFKSDVQPLSIAVLLDASPSLFPVATRTQGAVMQFAQRLLPADRATVGTFGHVVTLNPELTNDPAALIRRLGDDAPFPAGTALWDAIDAGRVAVSAAEGRRVVLVITDAKDNSSVADIDAVRTAIERSDVMVYGIGVRGSEGLETSEMRALARATGGWYFELRPTDDMAAAATRVAEELHRQYVIGFSPSMLDGRRHKLDVTAKKSGLTIRARRSYVASAAPGRGEPR